MITGSNPVPATKNYDMINLTEASKLLIGKSKTKAFLDGVRVGINTECCDEFLSEQYHSLVEEYFDLKKKYIALSNSSTTLKTQHKDLLAKYFDATSKLAPHNEESEKL